MRAQDFRGQACTRQHGKRKHQRLLPICVPRSCDRRKRRENGDAADVIVKFPNLVMGKVTILKRGEVLKRPLPLTESDVEDVEEKSMAVCCDISKVNVGAKSEDCGFCTVEPLGPEPMMVPKQIRLTEVKSVGAYSGSGFVKSPAPSDLPFPRFSLRMGLS